ncbi:hypothetical protein [Chryseobacterium daeguense]|uniref:hypothetical protein n=1 Tax=Chryseobacterium daeguense TaxID=412438 RepID=UPI0004265703|nr:hypothetical protein [Chryseobacterium daeguense]
MPNYKQLLESAAASFTITNVSAALAAIMGGAFIHDLYQRYKNYIRPADATADFLRTSGVFELPNNAAQNVEQNLDILRQASALRNQRQDDTRSNLSFLGWILSRFLREGHSDIDEIIARNIRNIAPGREDVSDEVLAIALETAIMGATRTRGWLTSVARFIGSPIYRIFIGFPKLFIS